MEISSLCGDRTYHALENLYLNSVEYQERIRREGPAYYLRDSIAFLKEYCTIRLCGPRQSGHTTSLSLLVQNYSLRGNIFLPSITMANRIRDMYYSGDKRIRLYSQSVLVKDMFSGHVIDFIACDCASFFSKNFESEVYKLAMVNYRDPFFIFFLE